MLDRRQFLGRAAVGSAAAAWTLSQAASLHADAASNKVVVGVMGLGRGQQLVDELAKMPGVAIKYVCDVDTRRVGKTHDKLAQAGHTSQAIGDFRQILDDPEIDALVCAAPNHWHAAATVLACKAGKHVYVEKPCSHTPWEGELMIQAARKYNRAVQMGVQRRGEPAIVEAMQLMREGEIGRVYCVHSYFWRGRGRDAIQLGQPSEPPAYLNFDLWQGPSPRVAYRDKRVPYNWHWFWQWGNGELGNNGVHVLDICRWGAGVDLPTRVTSSGGRYRYDDDQQTPDTHAVAFEFPEKVQITCQLVSCTHHQGPYATYYGEKGTIEVGLVNQYTLYDKDDKQVRQVGDGLRHDDVHLGNFLDAVRQDKPASLACDIAEGHKSTMLCHLGNIAQRSDHVLHCDPKTGQVLNDPEAMKLWKGEYAPGWEPTL